MASGKLCTQSYKQQHMHVPTCTPPLFALLCLRVTGLEGKKVEAEAYIDKQVERLRCNITGHTLLQRDKEVGCLLCVSSRQDGVLLHAPC